MQSEKTTRRGFLRGLIAAPFVARLGLLMPVKSALIVPPAFLPGDLIEGRGFMGARVVERVEGGIVYAWNNCFGAHARAEPIAVAAVRLFEGMPGNRVNNPSMRHRLVRPAGQIGLGYPEDFAHA